MTTVRAVSWDTLRRINTIAIDLEEEDLGQYFKFVVVATLVTICAIADLIIALLLEAIKAGVITKDHHIVKIEELINLNNWQKAIYPA